MESGNPVVKSFFVEDQLISEKDQAIANYFQEVYGGQGRLADSDADMLLWERL